MLLPPQLTRLYRNYSLPSSYYRNLIDLKLVLNAGKTKYMFFRAHKNKSNDLSICTLDGVQIDRVRGYKNLGIWIDEKLSF